MKDTEVKKSLLSSLKKKHFSMERERQGTWQTHSAAAGTTQTLPMERVFQLAKTDFCLVNLPKQVEKNIVLGQNYLLFDPIQPIKALKKSPRLFREEIIPI